MVLAVIAACGGGGSAVRPPSTELDPVARSVTTVTSAPVGASTSVSEDIARACNLHFNDILAKAPKFEHDQSDLSAADREVLTTIARCLSTGPLSGRTVKLVGRTDPRGAHEHNMALGLHRASIVASFLEHHGVDFTSIREMSRGDLDATGTDEATWQIDRRVDILLQD
jgi:peptidoglycan-associated lipoprotein